jgi:hypothetical protein
MGTHIESTVALVLLTARSGTKLTGDTRVTAQTLPEYAPDPADAAVVTEILQASGFKVGPMIGISMSIEGSANLFNEFFGTEVIRMENGGWMARNSTGEAGQELPTATLPRQLQGRIAAVTFEPPAELLTDEG